jgi:hypothetical protein
MEKKMQIQQAQLEEVKITEVSDDTLEQSGISNAGGSYSMTGCCGCW